MAAGIALEYQPSRILGVGRRTTGPQITGENARITSLNHICPKVLDDLRDALNAIGLGNVLALRRNAIHSPAAALRRLH
jgi:hypothetical protein